MTSEVSEPIAQPVQGGISLKALLWLGAIPFGVLLGFVVGIAVGVRGDDVWILALALLTGGVALVPVFLDRTRPPEKRQLMLSMMSLSYLVFFAAPAFTQYLMASEGFQPEVTRLINIAPRDIINGQVAALVGLLCMMAGFALPIGRMIGDALPQPSVEWSETAALCVAVVMIPFGWMIFLAGQFGLVPSRLGSGVLGALASWYYFGAALLMITYLRYRSRPALLLMVLMVPPAMAFSFFTGSKTLFLAPLMMIALSWVVFERRLKLRWVFAGFAAIVLLYPVAQFYREVVLQGNQLHAVQILSDPGRAFSILSQFLAATLSWEYLQVGIQATGYRLNALGITCVIVRDTPSPVPFQGGWSIGYIVIAYIPRLLWPGKPITTIGQWVTDNYTSTTFVRTNTGPSWLGELYFNFGYAGIIIGMLLMGIYFRVLQNYLMGRDAKIPMLLSSVVVIFATAMTLGGGLIGPINSVSFKVAPIILMHIAVRVFFPPTRSPVQVT